MSIISDHYCDEFVITSVILSSVVLQRRHRLIFISSYDFLEVGGISKLIVPVQIDGDVNRRKVVAEKVL